MSLGVMSWLPSELQRKEIKLDKYLDCPLPWGGEHGHLDDIDGEIWIDDRAIGDWYESMCLC